MSNSLFCYGCGAGLPSTAPASQPTVMCSYCKNPNKNPNFSKEPTLHQTPDKTDESTDLQDTQAVKVQKIVLSMSPLFSLYAGTTVLLSIIAGLLYIFFPQPYFVYFVSGIIAILPNVSSYFVEARWKKVVQHLTTTTDELYYVDYDFEAGWYQFICYVFMAAFVYDASKTILLLKYAEVPIDGKTGILILSLLLAIGFVWFSEKVLEVVGSAFGKIFSKNP